MKATQKLVELLATLQPEEKRHAKAVMKQIKEDTQALNLYELLLKHMKEDEYGHPYLGIDEEQLIFRLQRMGVKSKQFHVVRNNLQNALLKTLRQINEQTNQADEIRTLLRDAQILERRGLFLWAEELLQKALNISKKYEYPALRIETLYKLVSLGAQIDSKTYVEKINGSLQEMESTVKDYQEEVEIYSKWYQSFMLYRTRKSIVEEDLKIQIQKFLDDEGLSTPLEVKSFMGKVHAHQARAVLAELNEGSHAAHPWFKSIVKLWVDKPFQHMQKEHPRVFIIHISNYLGNCLATNNTSSYNKYLQHLEIFKPSSFDDRAELFQNLYNLKLFFCLNSGKFKEGKELLPMVLKGLNKYAVKINKARLLCIIYNMLMVLFTLGEYKSALQIHDDLNHLWKGSEQRRDIQTAIRFLMLLCHFDLDNFEELSKFLKQVKPNLSTEAPVKDFERIVLIHFVAIAEFRIKPEANPTQYLKREQEIYEKFLLELEAFKASLSTQVPAGYEEIWMWLKSKIEKIPFIEIVLRSKE